MTFPRKPDSFELEVACLSEGTSQLAEDTEVNALEQVPNRRIMAHLKNLREARTRHQMLRFDVGDRVRFQPPGQGQEPAMFVRHNRKTVTIVTDDRHQ